MMVDVEAGATRVACESVDERTVASRRHPPGTAMAMIRGRNLTETFKRFASA
jgi:hypothetical protein